MDKCKLKTAQTVKCLDIRVIWRSDLGGRVPECQKINKGGLDQYGPEQWSVTIWHHWALEGLNYVMGLVLNIGSPALQLWFHK